jgi:Zn-dependent peptidase ImmA (M78 family)
MKSIDATSAAISKDRLRLQNPYAHVDGDGSNRAYACSPMTTVKKNFYTDAEVLAKVQELQKWVWTNRHVIWQDSVPADPVDMLDPDVGVRSIGFEFDYVSTLGRYRTQGREIEVAGIVDVETKTVQISAAFAPEVRRFTAAHELAHALLHDGLGLHRDRPLSGEKLSRASREWEADKFAAFYLMPSKLLTERFRRLFLTTTFTADEDKAFALARCSLREFEELFSSRRDIARAIARAETYNGKGFTSLAAQFGVSVETMAIRLEELKLVV